MQWISSRVVCPLSERITRTDAEFKQQGMSHLDCAAVAPQQLAALHQQYPSHSLLNERVALEQFLGTSIPRKLLLARIKDLAVGGVLTSYTHATDARILVHLLFSYLNASMPTQNSFQYYCDSDTEPSGCLQIRLANADPVHFNVAVNGVVWDVAQGRNNVFVVF